ncbi:MAG: class II aldolase/adducin family protein [Planctomycetota bacterium]
MLKIFRQIGNALFISGLNHSHSGNISLRTGNKIYITRRGVNKGFLTKKDIVRTGMNKSRNDYLDSTEVNVHRAIYRATPAKAIIHCHPPIATALSLSRKEIIPADVEGRIALPKIPVLKCQKATASKELENNLPPLLKKYHSAIVRGHGVFCIGQSLEEAFHYATLTEHIAKILYYAGK